MPSGQNSKKIACIAFTPEADFDPNIFLSADSFPELKDKGALDLISSNQMHLSPKEKQYHRLNEYLVFIDSSKISTAKLKTIVEKFSKEAEDHGWENCQLRTESSKIRKAFTKAFAQKKMDLSFTAKTEKERKLKDSLEKERQKLVIAKKKQAEIMVQKAIDKLTKNIAAAHKQIESARQKLVQNIALAGLHKHNSPSLALSIVEGIICSFKNICTNYIELLHRSIYNTKNTLKAELPLVDESTRKKFDALRLSVNKQIPTKRKLESFKKEQWNILFSQELISDNLIARLFPCNPLTINDFSNVIARCSNMIAGLNELLASCPDGTPGNMARTFSEHLRVRITTELEKFSQLSRTSFKKVERLIEEDKKHHSLTLGILANSKTPDLATNTLAGMLHMSQTTIRNALHIHADKKAIEIGNLENALDFCNNVLTNNLLTAEQKNQIIPVKTLIKEQKAQLDAYIAATTFQQLDELKEKLESRFLLEGDLGKLNARMQKALWQLLCCNEDTKAPILEETRNLVTQFKQLEKQIILLLPGELCEHIRKNIHLLSNLYLAANPAGGLAKCQSVLAAMIAPDTQATYSFPAPLHDPNFSPFSSIDNLRLKELILRKGLMFGQWVTKEQIVDINQLFSDLPSSADLVTELKKVGLNVPQEEVKTLKQNTLLDLMQDDQLKAFLKEKLPSHLDDVDNIQQLVILLKGSFAAANQNYSLAFTCLVKIGIFNATDVSGFKTAFKINADTEVKQLSDTHLKNLLRQKEKGTSRISMVENPIIRQLLEQVPPENFKSITAHHRRTVIGSGAYKSTDQCVAELNTVLNSISDDPKPILEKLAALGVTPEKLGLPPYQLTIPNLDDNDPFLVEPHFGIPSRRDGYARMHEDEGSASDNSAPNSPGFHPLPSNDPASSDAEATAFYRKFLPLLKFTREVEQYCAMEIIKVADLEDQNLSFQTFQDYFTLLQYVLKKQTIPDPQLLSVNISFDSESKIAPLLQKYRTDLETKQKAFKDSKMHLDSSQIAALTKFSTFLNSQPPEALVNTGGDINQHIIDLTACATGLLEMISLLNAMPKTDQVKDVTTKAQQKSDLVQQQAENLVHELLNNHHMAVFKLLGLMDAIDFTHPTAQQLSYFSTNLEKLAQAQQNINQATLQQATALLAKFKLSNNHLKQLINIPTQLQAWHELLTTKTDEFLQTTFSDNLTDLRTQMSPLREQLWQFGRYCFLNQDAWFADSALDTVVQLKRNSAALKQTVDDLINKFPIEFLQIASSQILAELRQDQAILEKAQRGLFAEYYNNLTSSPAIPVSATRVSSSTSALEPHAFSPLVWLELQPLQDLILKKGLVFKTNVSQQDIAKINLLFKELPGFEDLGKALREIGLNISNEESKNLKQQCLHRMILHPNLYAALENKKLKSRNRSVKTQEYIELLDWAINEGRLPSLAFTCLVKISAFDDNADGIQSFKTALNIDAATDVFALSDEELHNSKTRYENAAERATAKEARYRTSIDNPIIRALMEVIPPGVFKSSTSEEPHLSGNYKSTAMRIQNLNAAVEKLILTSRNRPNDTDELETNAAAILTILQDFGSYDFVSSDNLIWLIKQFEPFTTGASRIEGLLLNNDTIQRLIEHREQYTRYIDDLRTLPSMTNHASQQDWQRKLSGFPGSLLVSASLDHLDCYQLLLDKWKKVLAKLTLLPNFTEDTKDHNQLYGQIINLFSTLGDFVRVLPANLQGEDTTLIVSQILSKMQIFPELKKLNPRIRDILYNSFFRFCLNIADIQDPTPIANIIQKQQTAFACHQTEIARLSRMTSLTKEDAALKNKHQWDLEQLDKTIQSNIAASKAALNILRPETAAEEERVLEQLLNDTDHILVTVAASATTTVTTAAPFSTLTTPDASAPSVAAAASSDAPMLAPGELSENEAHEIAVALIRQLPSGNLNPVVNDRRINDLDIQSLPKLLRVALIERRFSSVEPTDLWQTDGGMTFARYDRRRNLQSVVRIMAFPDIDRENILENTLNDLNETAVSTGCLHVERPIYLVLHTLGHYALLTIRRDGQTAHIKYIDSLAAGGGELLKKRLAPRTEALCNMLHCDTLNYEVVNTGEQRNAGPCGIYAIANCLRELQGIPLPGNDRTERLEQTSLWTTPTAAATSSVVSAPTAPVTSSIAIVPPPSAAPASLPMPIAPVSESTSLAKAPVTTASATLAPVPVEELAKFRGDEEVALQEKTDKLQQDINALNTSAGTRTSTDDLIQQTTQHINTIDTTTDFGACEQIFMSEVGQHIIELEKRHGKLLELFKRLNTILEDPAARNNDEITRWVQERKTLLQPEFDAISNFLLRVEENDELDRLLADPLIRPVNQSHVFTYHDDISELFSYLNKKITYLTEYPVKESLLWQHQVCQLIEKYTPKHLMNILQMLNEENTNRGIADNSEIQQQKHALEKLKRDILNKIELLKKTAPNDAPRVNTTLRQIISHNVPALTRGIMHAEFEQQVKTDTRPTVVLNNDGLTFKIDAEKIRSFLDNAEKKQLLTDDAGYGKYMMCYATFLSYCRVFSQTSIRSSLLGMRNRLNLRNDEENIHGMLEGLVGSIFLGDVHIGGQTGTRMSRLATSEASRHYFPAYVKHTSSLQQTPFNDILSWLIGENSDLECSGYRLAFLNDVIGYVNNLPPVEQFAFTEHLPVLKAEQLSITQKIAVAQQQINTLFAQLNAIIGIDSIDHIKTAIAAPSFNAQNVVKQLNDETIENKLLQFEHIFNVVVKAKSDGYQKLQKNYLATLATIKRLRNLAKIALRTPDVTHAPLPPIPNYVNKPAKKYAAAAKLVLREYRDSMNERNYNHAILAIEHALAPCQQTSSDLHSLTAKLVSILQTYTNCSSEKAQEDFRIAATCLLPWDESRTARVSLFAAKGIELPAADKKKSLPSEQDRSDRQAARVKITYMLGTAPVRALTKEQVLEYLKILDEDHQPPIWFMDLPKITQRFLSRKLHEWLSARMDRDNTDEKITLADVRTILRGETLIGVPPMTISGKETSVQESFKTTAERAKIIEEFNQILPSIPSSLRNVPGLANFSWDLFSATGMKADGHKVNFSFKGIRSSTLTPIGVGSKLFDSIWFIVFGGILLPKRWFKHYREYKETRRQLAEQNLRQLLESSLPELAKDRVATWKQPNGDTIEIPVLEQTLLSPQIFDSLRGNADESRMLEEKKAAIEALKQQGFSVKVKIGDQEFTVQPKFHSINHAINIWKDWFYSIPMRLFVKKHLSERDESFNKITTMAKDFLTKISSSTGQDDNLGLRDLLASLDRKLTSNNNNTQLERDIGTVISKLQDDEKTQDLRLLLCILKESLTIKNLSWFSFSPDRGSLLLVSLEQLAVKMCGGLPAIECKSSKDRAGLSKVHTHAMLAYYARYGRLPSYSDRPKNKERLRFIDEFMKLFNSSHQQKDAAQNVHIEWFKSLSYSAPKDIYQAIEATVHSKVAKKLSKLTDAATLKKIPKDVPPSSVAVQQNRKIPQKISGKLKPIASGLMNAGASMISMDITDQSSAKTLITAGFDTVSAAVLFWGEYKKLQQEITYATIATQQGIFATNRFKPLMDKINGTAYDEAITILGINLRMFIKDLIEKTGQQVIEQIRSRDDGGDPEKAKAKVLLENFVKSRSQLLDESGELATHPSVIAAA